MNIHKVVQILFIISGIILFLFFLLFLFVKYYEKNGVFFPVKNVTDSPERVGLPFDDIYFLTEDGQKLNAWFIANKKSDLVLLFFHGNAGNIGHRVDLLNILSALEINIFIFDYRGYGKSTGKPTEKGIYLDALGAYTYLIEIMGFLPENVIVYGKSIGTCPAIDLAAKKQIGKMIIDSGFSSAADMGKLIIPFFSMRILMSLRFNSIQKIKHINCEKFFIHSVNDEIVPFKLGKKLYDQALEPKEFFQTIGSHNGFFYEHSDLLVKKLREFIF